MNGFLNAFKSSLLLKILAGVVGVAIIGTTITVVILANKSKPTANTDNSTKSNSEVKNTEGAPAIFEDPEGTYNYCPSVIQVDSNTRYIYYCSNKDSKIVKDYIIVRKGELKNNKWVYGERQYALKPSDEGWDEVHTCDPDVIAGKFLYNGEQYNYLMAFLGCKTLDNTRNETGIAFAKSPEGPWIKFDKNPVIPYDSEKYGIFWGTGQPSLVSVDQKGKFLFYYTRGDKFSTRACVRECDFSDMSKPYIGEEIELPISGLSEADKSLVVVCNFDVARDPNSGKLILIRDRHPYGPSLPDNIASELQVFSGDSDIIYNPTKTWTELYNISEDDTGWPRNHNAGIVTDAYGNLLDSNKVEITYTGCDLGAASTVLWHYRLHSYTLDMANIN